MSTSTNIHEVTKAKVLITNYEGFSTVSIKLHDDDGHTFRINLFVHEKENLSDIVEALANPTYEQAE
jgi:hypothetical protein